MDGVARNVIFGVAAATWDAHPGADAAWGALPVQGEGRRVRTSTPTTQGMYNQKKMSTAGGCNRQDGLSCRMRLQLGNG